MKPIKIITIASSSLLLATALSLPTYANDSPSVSEGTTEPGVHTSTASSGNLDRQASDAWREGKLDTIYLFNRQLNNFTIDPEVIGSTVVLTGTVDSEVDKELAEQIAMGIDGIAEVTNRLIVAPSGEDRSTTSSSGRTFSDKVEDATLTAEVKTKLLANDETDGLSIHVDTVAREVTLTGDVESAAEKDLAAEITRQVDGVIGVSNKLQVKG
jgi:osmotically-inducible protein OsmY